MISVLNVGKTLVSCQQRLLASKEFLAKQSRFLWSERSLGIEDYVNGRRDTELKTPDPVTYKKEFHDNFEQKHHDFVKIEGGVKRLLHIINNSEYDFKVLKDALYTLVQKKKDYKGSSCFHIGPVLMRMFYYLNNPQVAYEFFEDERINPLCDDITTLHILMDLLYENKMYANVLQIHEILRRKSLWSKNTDVILFAACYRMNTPHAFNVAFKHWRKIIVNSDKSPFLKSRTFVAGLAVKQKRPQTALDVAQTMLNDQHVSVRPIKLLAWCQLREFGKIYAMLQATIKLYKKTNLNHNTPIEVFDTIEKTLERNQVANQKELEKFRKVRNEMESLGLITNETLDDILCEPYPADLPLNYFHKTNRNSPYSSIVINEF